jgi:putative nucleotidyltransferase with HDIG domain
VGGDELMLALVGCDLEQAQGTVERVRQRAGGVRIGAGRERLTISAGISEFPRHALGQEDLLHLADGAMYWAKSTGKDRSVVYTAESDLALSSEEAAQRQLKAGLVNTVHALARAVDAKDGYTHSHSQRVARYAAALAEQIGMRGEQLERVRTAGVLHDIGKIGIPDNILLSPTALADDDFAVMRRHSELGRDIIAGAGMDEVATWVLHLHERFDGGGYPAGLRGEEIPLESRILHCADALEAMTSSRVYRTGLPLATALERLEHGLGTQFDPVVGRVLLDLVRSEALQVGEQESSATVEPSAAVTAVI